MSRKSSPKYVESTLTKFLRNTAVYDKIYGRIEDNEQVVQVLQNVKDKWNMISEIKIEFELV